MYPPVTNSWPLSRRILRHAPERRRPRSYTLSRFLATRPFQPLRLCGRDYLGYTSGSAAQGFTTPPAKPPQPLKRSLAVCMALMAGHQIAIRALHGDFVRAVWRGPTRDESHRGTNSGCDRAGNSHRQLARVLLNDVDDDIASVLPRAEHPSQKAFYWLEHSLVWAWPSPFQEFLDSEFGRSKSPFNN